ncbi:hypothetical protein ACH50O_00685 [Methylomonas sp. 2BW1-5-20]|uniref:hypothetical protein n=1 Tax=Methylomonas sp. 2BW1-5-20 TaxID=3376686 RepID=UPI00404DAAB9
MIALAGIVVCNSIILIDFIENIYRGNPDISLVDAIIEAGATSLSPIFLTAASTLFSLVVIPVVHFLIYRDSAQVVAAHSGAVHAIAAKRARRMNAAKFNHSKLAVTHRVATSNLKRQKITFPFSRRSH